MFDFYKKLNESFQRKFDLFTDESSASSLSLWQIALEEELDCDSNENETKAKLTEALNSHKNNSGVLKESNEEHNVLHQKAMNFYSEENTNAFDELSDDELARLWSFCIFTDQNSWGQAYDDEVYDAINKRENSQEIFDKANNLVDSDYSLPTKKTESLEEGFDVRDWLDYHTQAACDCMDYYDADDLDDIPTKKILDWISQHEQLSQDMKRAKKKASKKNESYSKHSEGLSEGALGTGSTLVGGGAGAALGGLIGGPLGALAGGAIGGGLGMAASAPADAAIDTAKNIVGKADIGDLASAATLLASDNAEKESKLKESFWEPTPEFENFVDLESRMVDLSDWNYLTPEEKLEEVTPAVEKFYNDNKTSIVWPVFLDDLTDNNFHTERKAFEKLLYKKDESLEEGVVDGIKKVAGDIADKTFRTNFGKKQYVATTHNNAAKDDSEDEYVTFKTKSEMNKYINNRNKTDDDIEQSYRDKGDYERANRFRSKREVTTGSLQDKDYAKKKYDAQFDKKLDRQVAKQMDDYHKSQSQEKWAQQDEINRQRASEKISSLPKGWKDINADKQREAELNKKWYESLEESSLNETADDAQELRIQADNDESIYNSIQDRLNRYYDKFADSNVERFKSSSTSAIRKILFGLAKDLGLRTKQSEREEIATDYVNDFLSYKNKKNESLTEDLVLVMPEMPCEDCLTVTSTNVMAAYQNANKWLDTIKETLYTDLGCVFFSSYIHNLAHTMPVRFDKFGDILHTMDIKIPYPETIAIPQEPTDIGTSFELIFGILDEIKQALNEFIACTDESYHGMACSAETLLNDIESEYTPLFRMKKAFDACGNDSVKFDKWVGQYVANKSNLTEAYNYFNEKLDEYQKDNLVERYIENRKRLREGIEKLLETMSPEDSHDSEILRGISKRINGKKVNLNSLSKEEKDVLKKYNLDVWGFKGNDKMITPKHNNILDNSKGIAWSHNVKKDKINLADKARKVDDREENTKDLWNYVNDHGRDFWGNTYQASEREKENRDLSKNYHSLKRSIIDRNNAQNNLDSIDADSESDIARITKQRDDKIRNAKETHNFDKRYHKGERDDANKSIQDILDKHRKRTIESINEVLKLNEGRESEEDKADNELLRGIQNKISRRANTKLSDEEKSVLAKYGISAYEGRLLAGDRDLEYGATWKNRHKINLADRARKSKERELGNSNRYATLDKSRNFENTVLGQDVDDMKYLLDRRKYHQDKMDNLGKIRDKAIDDAQAEWEYRLEREKENKARRKDKNLDRLDKANHNINKILRKESLEESNGIPGRIIETGLDERIGSDIISSVIGQMSDGIWENSPAMEKYWLFADAENENIHISDKRSTDNGTGRTKYNPYTAMSDEEILRFFGNKVKEITQYFLNDNNMNPYTDFNEDNEEICTYLNGDNNVTVGDAYRAYRILTN